jgi:sulfite reductase alpha subunit-like flavoprotein
VLALGDTNYDKFCAAGKSVDVGLHKLGGSRLRPVACADEATGLEEVVEPWKEAIWKELQHVLEADMDRNAFAKLNGGEAKEETVLMNGDTVNEDDLPAVKTVSKQGTFEAESSPLLSPGVAAIKSLSQLNPTDLLPEISTFDLPAVGTSLSSCELLHSADEQAPSLEAEFNDRMTISSASSVLYSLNKPFLSTIVGARYLTDTDVSDILPQAASLVSQSKIMEALQLYENHLDLSQEFNGKRVIEVELTLPDDVEHQPGDSLGLIVPNPPAAVDFVVNMLLKNHQINASTQRCRLDNAHVDTVLQVLSTKLDLSSVLKNKRIIHSLSQHASGEDVEALRLLACKQHESVFDSYVLEEKRTIVDFLQEFPSTQTISLEALISMLPAISPRYYSIASSPLCGETCKIAFSVVDYTTPSGRRIGGVATRWLEALSSCFLNGSQTCPVKIPIFPKPSSDFHLPLSIATPLILIGPGTGIAPFIGFLHHRKAQLGKHASKEVIEGTWRGDFQMGENELPLDISRTHSAGFIDVYFGCRHANHDYLYRQELQNYYQTGLIRNLYVAFSRDDGSAKRYVQDCMTSVVAHSILDNHACVYICGDGNSMARDVQNKLVELLSARLRGQDDASRYLQDLKEKKRLVMDIWS